MDKLDGRISQELFDRQAVSMRSEQEGLMNKIQDIEKAAPAPVDEAIDMLRPTSRASELFLQQTASEQRRLLQTVMEKASWKDASLLTALFEPFEILRHSVRRSTEDTAALQGLIWLPKVLSLLTSAPVIAPAVTHLDWLTTLGIGFIPTPHDFDRIYHFTLFVTP